MKTLNAMLLLIFSLNCYAVDPAITEANDNFYAILKNIEIVKDKSQSKLERERAFSNFANEFGDPGANWQSLKVGVLEIIIADSNFWATQIVHFPAIQEKLINDFSMDWYLEQTSNYPEKLALAKVELIREIENLDLQKTSLKLLLEKLKTVKATSLE